jgi:NAD(P)-dependent dehydrogenase (short-subunit alcohol dehydrogenase family)
MTESKEADYQLPGLVGKTIVVTGGARGIGRSIVLEFIKQNALAVLDLDEARGNQLVNKLKDQGRSVFILKCDVTDGFWGFCSLRGY